MAKAIRYHKQGGPEVLRTQGSYNGLTDSRLAEEEEDEVDGVEDDRGDHCRVEREGHPVRGEVKEPQAL